MINWSKEAKYLGVTLDRKLFLKSHIQKNSQRGYRALRKLFPVLNKHSKLDVDVGLTIYKALIRSIITYACPVWGYAFNMHIKKTAGSSEQSAKNYHETPINLLHNDTRMETIKQYKKNSARRFYYSLKDHENKLVETIDKYKPTHQRHKTPTILLAADHVGEQYQPNSPSPTLPLLLSPWTSKKGKYHFCNSQH